MFLISREMKRLSLKEEMVKPSLSFFGKTRNRHSMFQGLGPKQQQKISLQRSENPESGQPNKTLNPNRDQPGWILSAQEILACSHIWIKNIHFTETAIDGPILITR
jgi:hypothetical protein